MKFVKFAIYKQDNIWGLESANHNYTKLIRSQHSSRGNAVNALFKRYPHTESFDLSLPDIKQAFKFQLAIDKDTKERLWLVEDRIYKSRAKALSSFFARHSGITLFYITVPVKVGVELEHGESSNKSCPEQLAGSIPTTPKGEQK